MRKWHKEPVSVELIRKLNERYKVDYITASLLARRDVTEPNDIRYVLESDVAYLHNSFLFNEMESFVERILEAKEENEVVCVFGDRDVDGISATVLLVEELISMGINVHWMVPQGDEPYGLTVEAIDKMVELGVTLIISVDCGISNIEEAKYAHKNHIDLLISDHHLPGDTLPQCVATINPKVPTCGYPFAHLAGCGVVAKIIWALRFAATPFYKESFILLHAYPGSTKVDSETVIVEAVRLYNCIEQERIVEEVVPGELEIHHSRMLKFLDKNLPIFAYDIETEKKFLQKAFGKEVEIHLTELKDNFEKALPHVKGKSLFALKNLSRSIRYSHRSSELDLLIALFNAFLFRSESSLSTDYEKILDLVALGTIGDLMPMNDENRILVKVGLKELPLGKRVGLLPLLTHQNLLGKRLTTNDIGWQITPIINASGRLGEPQIAVEMLLATDSSKSEYYAQKLLSLNKERQNQGEQLWTKILPKARTSFEDFEHKFLVVEDRTISRGLTGIMASRLLREFNVPALVIAQLDDQRITGSMRSPKNFNVTQFLALFDDLFIDYGGHDCAGGFSIERDKLDSFRKRLHGAIEKMQQNLEEDVEDPILIDAELPSEFMNPQLIDIVEVFEPYGESNPPLHFLIQNATIEDIQFLNSSKGSGPNHIKLLVQFGKHRWPALYWNGSEVIENSYDKGDQINLVFRLGRNYFRNSETLQLTVVAIEKYKTPIEKIMRLEGS
ncbi:MAG: single-stranded-DNA-specific exonuclease RecJ [Sphaerochaetaceae bacterium]|jgi:single-stranded-DNA-specific exonuclease